MPAQKGRAFLLQVDMTGAGSYTTVGGMRTTEETEEFGETDVTNKDSAGWFEQLADAAVKKLTYSCAGVFQNDTAARKLRDYGRAGSLNNMKLVFESGETVIAPFKVTNFQRNGEYNDALMYSFTLTSHGVPNFAG